MTNHTPTPWDWLIHDHSMASLGVMPDPGLGDPLVLTVSPCQACADRAEPREWKWGRCHTPSEADAEFILTAVNNHDALVKALQDALCELSACAKQMICTEGGSVHRAQIAARGILAVVSTQKERRYILSGGLCVTCSQHMANEMMPPHDASPRCESGKRNHCSCDVCF